MDELLIELTRRSSTTTIQLLRSTLPCTDVVREAMQDHARRAPAALKCFDMSDGPDQAEEAAVVQDVARAVQEGDWVYLANIAPEQDTLLRKVALLAFTSDPKTIHPSFRMWMSTLTKHTSFEPPPIHSGVALPRVLLHLCNAPQGLVGDADTMRMVEKYAPDVHMYDADSFSCAMADTAERLFGNDPEVTTLRYEASHARAHGADYFAMLPDAFRYNTMLATLDLTGCGIGDEGAGKLGSALRFNRGLVTIDLTRNLLSDGAVAALCEGLAHNASLKTLSLSRNAGIGDAGLEALGAALHTSGLESLSLERNNSLQSSAAWSRRAIGVLWDGVAGGRLRHLNARGCELSGFSVAALAARLEGNTTLTELELSSNRIGAAGVVPLARLLKHKKNVTIETLILDDCCIECDATACLGAALKHTASLRLLSMSRASPGKAQTYRSVKLDAEEEAEPTPPFQPEADERLASPPSDAARGGDDAEDERGGELRSDGIVLLSEGLAANTSLRSLRMGTCLLTDGLVKHLCDALTTSNDTLTFLDLSSNHAMGDAGSQAVQSLLRGGFGGEHGCALRMVDVSDNSDLVGERAILALDSTPVEELHLRHVGVTDGVALTLRDAIAHNVATALTAMDLSYNALHKEGLARMGELLNFTPSLLRTLVLRGNLNSAHQNTFSPLHDRGTKREGLSMFKDGGVDEVTPFHRQLAKLRPEHSSLTLLDLQGNSLTDECVTHLLDHVEALQVPVTIDISHNHYSSAIIPVIDAFALKGTKAIIVADDTAAPAVD